MDTASTGPCGSTTVHALALANTEALANWMALWMDMWMRAAAARNPL